MLYSKNGKKGQKSVSYGRYKKKINNNCYKIVHKSDRATMYYMFDQNTSNDTIGSNTKRSNYFVI